MEGDMGHDDAQAPGAVSATSPKRRTASGPLKPLPKIKVDDAGRVLELRAPGVWQCVEAARSPVLLRKSVTGEGLEGGVQAGAPAAPAPAAPAQAPTQTSAPVPPEKHELELKAERENRYGVLEHLPVAFSPAAEFTQG